MSICGTADKVPSVAPASPEAKTSRAPAFCRIHAASFGCSLALIGTAAAPAIQMP